MREQDITNVARELAREWLRRDPVFFDTETTGLEDHDEICELAVLDCSGTVLLETLVRPTILIPPEATQVHGIEDSLVRDAPSFSEVWPGLREIVQGRHVVIYNAGYDVRLLRQSARAAGFDSFDHSVFTPLCAMELYAQFFGQWDDVRGNFCWQKLGTAASQCGIELDLTLHRARADAEIARRLLHFMARGGERLVTAESGARTEGTRAGRAEWDVELFTDGACSGNPGPGGWAAILRHPATGKESRVSGGERGTTNNRMELMAAIGGLEKLKKPCRVRLVSDSQYVIRGLTEWLPDWKRRGWRTAGKRPVLNQDLWQRLDQLAAPLHLTCQWIRGHSGHPENEECDRLAREEIERLR